MKIPLEIFAKFIFTHINLGVDVFASIHCMRFRIWPIRKWVWGRLIPDLKHKIKHKRLKIKLSKCIALKAIFLTTSRQNWYSRRGFNSNGSCKIRYCFLNFCKMCRSYWATQYVHSILTKWQWIYSTFFLLFSSSFLFPNLT